MCTRTWPVIEWDWRASVANWELPSTDGTVQRKLTNTSCNAQYSQAAELVLFSPAQHWNTPHAPWKCVWAGVPSYLYSVGFNSFYSIIHMSVLATSTTAQKDFCFQFSFFKQMLKNTELFSQTENLLLLKKSNDSWSEDTVNQNIKKNLFLCFLHCPGEVSLRNKTTCLSVDSSICDKCVVSLQVSLASKGILLWCTLPWVLPSDRYSHLRGKTLLRCHPCSNLQSRCFLYSLRCLFFFFFLGLCNPGQLRSPFKG